MDLAPGAPAPDFALDSSSGPVTLASFRGRALVLYFYPKDDTSGCTAEALQFTALADEFAAAGATVLGVSRDSLAAHQRFIARHGLRMALASDPETTAIAAYGSWVQKSMYGRSYMGIDRSTFLIDEAGRILALWRKVKVRGHAEAVLQALRDRQPVAR